MSDDYFRMMDDFLFHCETKNLSRKTMMSYEQALSLFGQYVLNEYGATDVAKVKADHVKEYIRYVRERGKYTVTADERSWKLTYADRRTDHGKQVSETTLANYLRIIKVFFRYLYDERIIRKNPIDSVPAVKPDRKRKSWLTEKQLQKIIRTFDWTTFYGFRSMIITRLLLDTGMRIGECLDIVPEDINFRENSILVRNPKNRKERYVFFSPKMGRELKRWIEHRDRHSDSPFMFPTNRGRQLQISSYERTLREAGRKHGIDVTPHQLRNNFAKYYLMNGGDIVTLSRILGHSSVEITQQVYLDFTEQEVGKKYQRHSPLNSLDI